MSGTSTLLVAITVLGALIVVLYMASNLMIGVPLLRTTTVPSYPPPTIPMGNATTTPPSSNATVTIPGSANTYSNSQLVEYALRNINAERALFGLKNVTLSNATSGQQHADSMLYYGYFSHWDPFGMKPYMRYTLLGGNQGVDENVAYNEQVNQSCHLSLCAIQQINVTAAIGRMEYQMLYNDSGCCNNGHRNNTLDPNHNQVSIGVAYNKTNAYLVEDFIDNYVEWLNMSPGISSSGEIVYLNGLTLHGANFSFVQVNYDPAPQNMSDQALSGTQGYNGGQALAGVTYGPYYYQNVSTIYATTYVVNKNYFNVVFNLTSLTQSYGAGVYTINLFLTNSSGDKFDAATYSIFINSAGQPYTPGHV